MARYRVTLEGCDDKTVMYLDLAFDEWTLLERIAQKSRRVSDYDDHPQCKPVMLVELAENEKVDDGE